MILSSILKRVTGSAKVLVFTISMILLVIGVAIMFDLGVILAAMTAGVAVANTLKHRRESTFGAIEKFSPPIYALFFVMAGAHLVVGDIQGWMVIMVVVSTIKDQ